MGTPYSAILTLIVTAGVLNVLMGLYAVSGRSKLAMVKTFFIFSILSAVYAFASALELASNSIEEIRFWIKIEYLGMPFLPPLNLLIIMTYLGMERYLKRWVWMAMLAMPLSSLLLVMTSEFHHFYYRDIVLRAGTSYLKADVIVGPWYIIQGAYTFGCMIGGVVLLLRGFRKMPAYRVQLGTMLLGLLLPLAGDFLYLGGLTPDGMDPIPVIMTLTSALYLWALASKGLFHVAPIARDNLFTSMRDGVLVLDRYGRLVDYNPVAASMMPEMTVASIGQELQGIWTVHTTESIPGLTREYELSDQAAADIQEIQWQLGSNMFNYQVRSSVVRNQGGQRVGQLIVMIDVTERTRLQEQLRKMAYYDGLTRIYNRAHFMELSSSLLAESVRSELPLSFVLFDIDHFKRINDIYGHDIGDQALLHIVDVCRRVLRSEDIFARYGGEEFVIAMPGLTTAACEAVAQRIRMELASQPLQTEQGIIPMTASFGIAATSVSYKGLPGVEGIITGISYDRLEVAAAWAEEASSVDANLHRSMERTADQWEEELKRLLKLADLALYEAKHCGRNTVRIAGQI